MKRVVITGLGIISSIGNNKKKVLSSLQNSKSGIIFSRQMKEFGIKSNIWGALCVNIEKIDRTILKFMNRASIYTYFAMKQAIRDSCLNSDVYQKNYRVGIITGSGCNVVEKNAICMKKKQNLYSIIQNMPSNISACLSTFYNIYGISNSLSAACATSLNCINYAVELIQYGKQDIIFAGGAEELTCELAAKFDIMNALSVKYNFNPSQASRPYDINRDGFVISGGSGILVLEELEHARSRKARIYAEVIGFGSASDGLNMIRPSGLGLVKAMKIALYNADNIIINYINTHGTSTKVGDFIELKAIKQVFRKFIPYLSSTKSMTGHSLGASGVHEIIYVILMMYNNFIAPNINIDCLAPFAKNMNIVTRMKPYNIMVAMSNSCGFGGINSSIILKKYL
ncbi:beta-ketoacyl synthase N-terminal-like domain-containing protein [Buchnera aphidicola (Takecallis taiwana)]|uniref:beta-ketoacyl synthase N-terminal-like domain-containing protein n=1 Tax=Buchnera aphidicola TaxID=9 RepID=UPI0031B6EEF8